MTGSRRLFVLTTVALVGCAAGDGVGARRLKAAAGEAHPVATLVSHFSELPRAGGYSTGSAIKLPGNRLLTARHVLPEHAFGIRIETVGMSKEGTPTLSGLVDGNRIEYRVLLAGRQSGDISDDWAVIEVKGINLSLPEDITIEFDFQREVNPADELLLVGFPNNRAANVLVPVVDPPRGLAVPQRILCIQAPSRDPMEGMSGGSALLWYPEDRRAVVIGLYRGMRRLEGFGIVWQGVHTVVRPPPDILR